MSIFNHFKRKKSKNNELIVKLSEDDILRILVTNFQSNDFGESWGYGELLGSPGKDLRFIGVFRTDIDNAPFNYDIKDIDSSQDFYDD
ncbi:MAG: hypothetical protein NC213_10130 [Acetobacter sp.]|nr:hypothetical protein [Bacteroides sp.]MCM1342091.1 hypothetical protein [Acetobacter sp.]MCM1434300.1 hypothetical protein [Clostridiales bacterium]